MNDFETLYFVYVLKSITTGQFYVGSCDDLIARFNQHQSECHKSTRGRGPWWLPYYEIYESRLDAQARKSEIKSKKSSRYIRTIIYDAFPLMNLD